MTKNIDSKKVRLIEEIASIHSEAELDRLIKIIRLLRLKTKHGDSVLRKTRDSISIEELKKKQNYKEFDREEFDQIVNDLDIQDSIDDLLAMID